MIFYCRPIPHLISKHIRTFFSTPALSIKGKKYKKYMNGSEHVANYWKSKTVRFQQEYRMIQLMKGNVRILQLTNSDIHRDDGYCIVRVGVGSADDPLNYLGLAHLLEHAMASTALLADAETKEFTTFYRFQGGNRVLKETLRRLSDAMFTPESGFKKEIIQRECRRVHLEFLGTDSTTFDLINLIFGTHLRVKKFTTGNLASLWKDQDTSVLIEQLEKLRAYFRKRQVLVCIYTNPKQMLPVDELCNSWTTGPIEPIEAVNNTLESRNPKKEDFSRQLFVVATDITSLRILFPFNKRLSSPELQSMQFVCHLVELNYEGYLRHHLLTKKWGMECHAFCDDANLAVTVDLTEEGLKNITKVKGAIFKYFNVMVHEWENVQNRKISFFSDVLMEKFPIHDKYIRFIAEGFDVAKDELDEFELMTCLESATEEIKLIRSQIIKNENAAYSIHTRDMELVAEELKLEKVLKGPNNKDIQIEEHTRTKFIVFETDLLKAAEPVSFDFNIVDMTGYDSNASEEDSNASEEDSNTSDNIHRAMPCIFEPQDLVYQELCRVFLREHGSYFEHASEESEEEYVLQLDAATMKDDDTFDITKRIAMLELSKQMNDSEALARSLLDTAVQNIYHRPQVIPIPMIYNAMPTVNRQAYINHFARLGSCFPENILNEVKTKDVNLNISIESINKRQLLTVTSHVFIYDQLNNQVKNLVEIMDRLVGELRNDLAIYDIHVRQEEFGSLSTIDGIVLQAATLESNEDQTHDIIQEKLKLIMQNEHVKKAATKPVYDFLMKKQICVQIKGYKEAGDNHKFEDDFAAWFDLYKTDFERLIDPYSADIGPTPSMKRKPK